MDVEIAIDNLLSSGLPDETVCLSVAALKAAMARAKADRTRPCSECPYDNRCEDSLDCPHDKEVNRAEAEFVAMCERQKEVGK